MEKNQCSIHSDVTLDSDDICSKCLEESMIYDIYKNDDSRYNINSDEIMDKQENWWRDKGITMTIGEARGYDTLDFLING